jgi:putative monooxygenase
VDDHWPVREEFPLPQPRITKVAAKSVTPNRRRGGELRVVLGPATTGATTGFLGVLRMAPGEHVSEHYHPYSEEFLYVISGALTVRVDGEPVELAAGEGMLVPKHVRHSVHNDTDRQAEAVFHLCPLAPRPELGHVDTEPLPAPAEPQPDIGSVR